MELLQVGERWQPVERRQAVAVQAEHRQFLQPTQGTERAVAQSVVAEVELAERAELPEPRDRRQPVPLELEVLELREAAEGVSLRLFRDGIPRPLP